MKFSFKHILILLLPIMVGSCAQTGVLTGGEKDITPPTTYDSICIPENYTTNFNSNTIIIPFDEYFRLNDAQNQVVISPPLPQPAEFKIQKKNLLIELPDSLLPNTTYLINFGNAIQDITESNTVNDLKYVFSTGSVIDSLNWTGTVRNAYTLASEKNVWVMLYSDHSDSIPYKELPRYFAKTNEKGQYFINYIKDGNYKAFALRDENLNYRYDLPTEQIAFSSDTINPRTSLPGDLLLFMEDLEALYIKSESYTDPGRIELIFNKTAPKATVRLIQNGVEPQIISTHVSEFGDSLEIWMPKNAPDTLELIVQTDSTFSDTLFLIKKYQYTNSKRTTVKTPPLTLTDNTKGNFDLNRPIILKFNRPLLGLIKDSIILSKDSIPIPFELSPMDSLSKKWSLTVDWEPTSVYELIVLPGAAQDSYDIMNKDSLRSIFKTQRENYYAKLIFDLQVPETDGTYLLTLMDEKSKPIRKVKLKKSQKIEFDFLGPGNYLIRLEVDSNNSGRWDTGNYLEGEQAEKIIYFDGKLELRSNWDLKQVWKVNFDEN